MEPKLKKLGFERIKIRDNWICPTFLYEHDDIWFGSSWDWRDFDLNIDLGKLFFFHDVMPRVIVLGPIKIRDSLLANDNNVKTANLDEYFAGMFQDVNESLDEKIAHFNEYYSAVYNYHTKINEVMPKKKRQYRRLFLEHLGKQMKKSDLPL